MIRSRGRNFIVVGGFLLCVVVAFLMRGHHYALEAKKFGEFVPFTLESAMMYSYALEAAETGRIPTFDDRLVGMKDVAVHRQMSIGLEYFVGYGYRLKCLLLGQTPVFTLENPYEYNPAFAHWVRLQMRFWISLGAGFVLLWLVALGCRWQTALLGGMLFAVAPAAVARATGQDLIMENFAVTPIIAAFAWYHLSLRGGGRLALLLMAVSAYVALATWDMCQLCFGLFVVWECVRIMGGGAVTRRRRTALVLFAAAALLAGLTVPYLQTHRFLCSPMMTIALPALLVLAFVPKGAVPRKGYAGVVLWAIFAVIWYVVWRHLGYGGAYDHFWSLLKAKIHFMNVKPPNPGALDFDSRILWTPALHSASVRESLFLFANIGFTLMAVALVLVWPWGRRAFVRELPRIGLPLFMAVVFCVLYIFMVRFHALGIIFLCVVVALLFDRLARFPSCRVSPLVMLLAGAQSLAFLALLAIAVASTATGLGFAVFIAVGLGGGIVAFFTAIGAFFYYLCTKSLAKSWWPRRLVFMSLLLVVGVEAEWSGCIAEGIGRKYGGEYLKEKAELIKWFRSEGLENEVILTDFTLSPMLKAYCRERIILQPKFELGRTRDMVREYLDLVYRGDERTFNAFCVKNEAKYYVFDRGLAGPPHIYSSRYVANAIDIGERAPVRRFIQEPDGMRLFYRIDPPRWVSKEFSNKYVVFKIITPDDHKRALAFTAQAKRVIGSAEEDLARRLVKAAVYADPNHEPARVLYAQIFGEPPNIRLRGF